MSRGVIFDIDGTLVDSNRLHAESWAETLTAFGYAVTADQVQPLIGMGGGADRCRTERRLGRPVSGRGQRDLR